MKHFQIIITVFLELHGDEPLEGDYRLTKGFYDIILSAIPLGTCEKARPVNYRESCRNMYLKL